MRHLGQTILSSLFAHFAERSYGNSQRFRRLAHTVTADHGHDDGCGGGRALQENSDHDAYHQSGYRVRQQAPFAKDPSSASAGHQAERRTENVQGADEKVQQSQQQNYLDKCHHYALYLSCGSQLYNQILNTQIMIHAKKLDEIYELAYRSKEDHHPGRQVPSDHRQSFA